MKETHYELLGLAPDFTEDDLRSAWRKAVLRLHPDVNKSPRGAEHFKRVLAAYHVLRAPDSRARYHEELKRLGIQIPEPGRRARPKARAKRDPIRLRHVGFHLRYRFGSFPYPEGYRKPRIDPLVRRLPREELRHRILHSRNPFVQATAALALRVRGEWDLLFDAALHAEGAVLRELLRCLRGCRLRRGFPALLSLYEAQQGNMDRELLREFQGLLDSLDRDFARWLLERYRGQKALPGHLAAESLLSRLSAA